MKIRTLSRLCVLAALPLLSAGCAPSLSGGAWGPGLHLGVGLGSSPRLSIGPATCLLQGTSAATHSASAAATAGALRQQAAHIQARHSLGARSVASMESWKRLASGGC